ncbi:MAG: T9SS type A sorting domain-containing protein [Candidatus Zixiibacteriota bacterium]
MSLRERKTLVFVSVIILLLSLQGANISWSEEKRAAKPKNKSMTNHSNLYEKSEITKEKVYRIELNTSTPEDLEFFKRLGLECVQGEKTLCNVNDEQIQKLEKSGYEFSIIKEGIQVNNTPSNFGLNSSSSVSVSDTNGTNYDIPWGEYWAYSEIEIADAPSCASVTTIDIQFDIIHPRPSDLLVDLTNQEEPYLEYRLWNYEGVGQNDIHKTETNIYYFQGEPVNQIWTLWAWDAYEDSSGYIDYWKITIWYEIKMEGDITYLNYDIGERPLRQVEVQVYDYVTDDYISNIYFTDNNGHYIADFDYTGNYVYIKIIFDNMFIPIATIRDHDDLEAGPITTENKELLYVEPCGGTKNVYLYSSFDKCLKAAHIWDYILMERDFVSYYTNWTRPLIPCELDDDEYTELSEYSYIGGQEKIYFTNALEGWQDEAVLHEYAHAIHMYAHEDCVETGGVFHGHEPDWVTNSKFAFWEGWAEFMSCIVPYDDPTRVYSMRYGYSNIEDNDWWRGVDTNNTNGSVVEGAVASALYDLQDDHYDSLDEYNNFHGWSASLYDLFPDIFAVFQQYNPGTIIEFADDWKKYNFYSHDPDSVLFLKNAMVAIFRNHKIWVPFHADDYFVTGPQSFSLSQNYPNPFNSQTVINYDIPSEGMVSLTIYNILGQKVKTCVKEKKMPGYYTYLWNAKNDKENSVASGVYIYRLDYNNKQVSKVMLLLK